MSHSDSAINYLSVRVASVTFLKHVCSETPLQWMQGVLLFHTKLSVRHTENISSITVTKSQCKTRLTSSGNLRQPMYTHDTGRRMKVAVHCLTLFLKFMQLNQRRGDYCRSKYCRRLSATCGGQDARVVVTTRRYPASNEFALRRFRRITWRLKLALSKTSIGFVKVLHLYNS